MAPSLFDKQIAGCNLPHNWLMSFTMELTDLCDTYVEVKMAQAEAIWLFSALTYPLQPLHGPHHLLLSTPIRVLVVLATPVKTI